MSYYFTKGILNKLIPITQFNRGKANRIFDRLLVEQELIILKNNQPIGIILSPKKYENFCQDTENYRDLLIALRGIKNCEDPIGHITSAMKTIGIYETEPELEEIMLQEYKAFLDEYDDSPDENNVV